jgi:chromosome segregation ATPase
MPLIRKLKYAQEYDKAMQYVFGRTLLCRNLKYALDFADESDFDCITIDGDRVSVLKSIFYIKSFEIHCNISYWLKLKVTSQ